MLRVAEQYFQTDTGRQRSANEDAYFARAPVFAVADGMGGAQAGEIASALAAAALEGNASGTEQNAAERVAGLIQEANRRVHQRALEDPGASGMGTTMTVALVEDESVTFGHVGDSRAYLLRDGKLDQLTQDHSLVAELVRTGKLSEEEAESHPQRSVITRAVGTDPDVDVDTFAVETRIGDLFLICSDGLTDMVDHETLREIVERKRDDVEQAARDLIAAANRAGGQDNITIVFFEIAEGDASDDGATVELPALDTQPHDDDTLDEVDRVPAVDTMVVPAEQVEEAYQRQQKRKRRQDPRLDKTAKRVLSILVVLAFVAIAVVVLLWGLFF